MWDKLLQVDHLKVQLKLKDKTIYAVKDISFTVEPNQIVALIGESGCGKTMAATSILRLNRNLQMVIEGKVLFEQEDLLLKSEKQMQAIRGQEIGMVYQEPMSALNPNLKIGYQLKECLTIHKIAKGRKAKEKVIDMLKRVEIQDAQKRYHSYPHELSGGMQQRVVIAMAMLGQPKLLIADEPTTALDVSVQAKILKLMKRLKEETGMSMLIISHDIDIVAELADQVMIMYGGMIVEKIRAEDLFEKALHPYTKGLLKCIPTMSAQKERLFNIEGQVIDMSKIQSGCPFYERCESRMDQCATKDPVLTMIRANHEVRCWLYADK